MYGRHLIQGQRAVNASRMFLSAPYHSQKSEHSSATTCTVTRLSDNKDDKALILMKSYLHLEDIHYFLYISKQSNKADPQSMCLYLAIKMCSFN